MAIADSSEVLIEAVEKARERLAELRSTAPADPPLPDWALLPLRMAGMSAAELAVLSRPTIGGDRPSLHHLREAEADLEMLEDELVAAGPSDLRTVRLLVELALDRVRETALADRNTVFYDSPEARLERLLVRAAQALAGCDAQPG